MRYIAAHCDGMEQQFSWKEFRKFYSTNFVTLQYLLPSTRNRMFRMSKQKCDVYALKLYFIQNSACCDYIVW